MNSPMRRLRDFASDLKRGITAYERGYLDGFDEGYNEGHTANAQDRYQEGYEEGYEAGFAEAGTLIEEVETRLLARFEGGMYSEREYSLAKATLQEIDRWR